MPEPDRLELLVEDAFRLWKDIPTGKIVDAVDAAIIQAGNFEATAGLVAKCWNDGKKSELHLGSTNRLSVMDTIEYVKGLEDMPKNDPVVIDEFFKSIRERLKS